MTIGPGARTTTAISKDTEGEQVRGISEYSQLVSEAQGRSLSPRSVSRTPSSKYRFRSSSKKLADVSLQSDVEEEEGGDVHSLQKDQADPKTRSSSTSPTDSNIEETTQKNDQRSISSEICISPSWSRAANKKRKKKELKRQEKEHRELESRLRLEANKYERQSKREPRRLTKRPPPTTSSRASSANSRMPRPSTASSLKSFWSNRTSRASSINESDQERGGKRASWFPRIWPKLGPPSRPEDPKLEYLQSKSEPFTTNIRSRSLHTVRKHSDLRAIAKTFDAEEGYISQSTNFPSNSHQHLTSTGKRKARKATHSLALDRNSQQSELGTTHPNHVQIPNSTIPSANYNNLGNNDKPLHLRKLGGNKLYPRVVSRIPVPVRPTSPQMNSHDKPLPRGPWKDTADDSKAIPQAAPHSPVAPSTNATVVYPKSEMPKKRTQDTSENHDVLSPSNIVPPPDKVLQNIENSRSAPATESPSDAIEGQVTSIPKQHDETPQKPLGSVQQTTLVPDPKQSHTVLLPGSDTNRQKLRHQRNNSYSRELSFRPSPLSGPPLIVPESEGSAEIIIPRRENRESTKGPRRLAKVRHQSIRIEPSKSSTDEDVILSDRVGESIGREDFSDHHADNSKPIPMDDRADAPYAIQHIAENPPPSVAFLKSKLARGGNPALTTPNTKPSTYNTIIDPPATNPIPSKSRRNSFDIVQRMRLTPGKPEVKLKKQRPVSMEVPSRKSSAEVSAAGRSNSSERATSEIKSHDSIKSQRFSLPTSLSFPRDSTNGKTKITAGDYFSRARGKPWVASSSSLSSLASIGAGSSSRGYRHNQNQRIAKMFVICCQCKFWHDMPSEAYARLAFPYGIPPQNETTKKNGQRKQMASEGGPKTGMETKGPISSKINGHSVTATQSIPHTEFPHPSPPNHSEIKCCWCNHRMSKACCAGWTAIVKLHEQHH